MKKNVSSQRGDRILLICLAVLLCAFALEFYLQRKTPAAGAANETAQVVDTGSAVKVVTASHWQNEYPDEYASFLRNEENDQVVDYVEQYPIIATIYEGNAFGKFYSSARGHTFTLEDVSETGRPHGQAKCITCKTSDYTILVNTEGNEVYSRPFDDVMAKMNEAVSCYNCHADSGDSLVVTHAYLINAMGNDLSQVEPENLSCGQCHVEYYFAAEDQSTTLPYTSLETMTPEAMLAYYNEIGFVDYVNPRTGTEQLKAQHPEFETFLGEGSKHAGMLTCADCHMGVTTSSQGYGIGTYSDHYLVSPLEKPEILNTTCARCHEGDVAELVHAIQDEIEARTIEVGEKLVALTNALAEAVESGKYSEEELNAVRSLNRDAQFYWDFVFVENSEGAHNSELSRNCLNKAEALIDEAMALL
ncbi:MAG: ammonia-forming cytochrome c nitrite reductase subunit c552 [Oscillospiraceae bacterium]|nr:ammonia-forming cytochrome c nitrite reductase subunit c552 [Oscillospiraceae bacterium]